MSIAARIHSDTLKLQRRYGTGPTAIYLGARELREFKEELSGGLTHHCDGDELYMEHYGVRVFTVIAPSRFAVVL